jgi:hypothetical protein
VAEVNVKGISLIHLRDFLVAAHGEEGLRAVAGSLSPGVAKALATPAAMAWYPLKDYVEIERAVIGRFYGGDVSQAARIGRHDLEESLNKVYRFLFQFMEPTFLIKRSARLWNTFISGGGIELEQPTPRSARIRLRDLDTLHPVYCHDLSGSFAGALSACGQGHAVVAHTECRFRGGKACVFEGRW